MFARKEEKPKRRRTPRENLPQFGFMDMNADGTVGMDDEDGDDDLEAELLALTSDSSSGPKHKKAKPKIVPPEALQKMVNESMKDVDDEDDDESVDENDEDLLGELNDLIGPDDAEEVHESAGIPPEPEKENKPNMNTETLLKLLEERLKMYQAAEANAKSAGETSRARRFNRGSKTLLDQIKSVRMGRTINEEDIPPPVATRAGGSAPSPAQISSSEVPADGLTPSRTAPPPPAPLEPSTQVQVVPNISPQEINTGETNGDPSDSKEESSDRKAETEDTSSGLAPPDQSEDAKVPTFDPLVIAKLEERRGQYSKAAVAAKKAGDRQTALKFAQIVKKFDIVIEGVKSGQPADLSEMPPPPWEIEANMNAPPTEAAPVEDQHQAASAVLPPQPTPPPQASEAAAPPPVPKTILEALQQRLEVYQKQEAAAKADGNSRKMRQMGRIVKQYQDSIKLHKAGKAIAVDELPTPPGYPPFPVIGGSASTPAPSISKEVPAVPTAPVRSITPPPQSEKPASGESTPTSSASGSTPKQNVRKSPASRQEKQLSILLERQKDFKVAALQAKSRGEINQAKEYLRHSKGFDKLIEATKSGLPVDLKTLPVPPNAKVALEADFDVIAVEDCVAGTDDEIYEKIVSDLQKQVQTCMTTRDHFKAIGDIASANRFENMAVHSKKDMDAVKHAFRRKDPVPKFHYETRNFSIVQCCTDLMDNDLELTIVQGTNYNVPNPKDVDTYVRFELPWPSAEEPQKDRTNLIKDTNNPVYDGKFKLQIQRNVRACQRIFKRQAIKCEVWSRGGFFRSDTLIGTANVKLQPLETKCILHDSFDLMEGRKSVGGKLEVKIRIRNPIVTKQVEEVTEKWLVIDRL